MSAILNIGNASPSLSLSLPGQGMPEILAFGPEPVSNDIAPVAKRASRVNGMDVPVPSALLLPNGGMGFFGWPAIAGHRDGQDFVAMFQDWSAEGGVDRTLLVAADPVAQLSIRIEIEAHDTGVVSFGTTLTNQGDGDYTVDRCMAASMLVGPGPADITSFAGMWGREFHAHTEPLGSRLWLQESRRGRTSHDRFPGLFVEAGNTVLGVHLGWSGNHLVAVDTLDDGKRLVHAGELFEPGEMRLAAGESYVSPKAYLTTAASVPEAAERFRGFVSSSLLKWPGAGKPRPVMLNTWEGNYFDHRLESLRAQADAAAKLGIERFVLDDGWFGSASQGRDDDTTSLGDWAVDARKYPDGLKALVGHVRGLGMEFGIWFEPEMVNPDSELYRTHPDWVLRIKGRPLLLSRHQLVLDLTRPEVGDYLFARLDHVLRAHDIAYVKWDMNRDITHAGGRDGRAATSRQTRAFYALVDRVRAAHPNVEVESCASGGGRADYGVLERTHRLWTSDGTDALERLEIQRGASLFFPPSILGAHISGSPNHQTGRRHSLSFRAVVALAYHLGVELNPLMLDDAERAELAFWIALHKRLRPLLHGGRSFQLAPLDGRYVWGATTAARIVLFVAQAGQMLTEQPPPLVMPAMDCEPGKWRIASISPAEPAFIRMSDGQRGLLGGQTTFSLETLRRGGLPLPMLRPESGMVLELERIEGN
ncbi:alpha-galactosidase [Mesorhizobium loti NZP2037]|nr:alpha-galactosidase [Mesorhizobium loti]ANN57198.1 alpha-galactosidase [Mesorhizobium loti NZP2037]